MEAQSEERGSSERRCRGWQVAMVEKEGEEVGEVGGVVEEPELTEERGEETARGERVRGNGRRWRGSGEGRGGTE